MSYTPTTWTTGDTITATAMNKIEQGIANAGGSPWDAVIRLTHAENSGYDTPENLTPSIVSGSFADLSEKIGNGGCPCILVEYQHATGDIHFSAPMGYLMYTSNWGYKITVAGYSAISEEFTYFGQLLWLSNDTIVWN